MEFYEIEEYLKKHDISDIKELARTGDEALAERIDEANSSILDKALDIVTRGAGGWFESMTEAVELLWTTLWNTAEFLLPPLFHRLSRLRLLGDMEYQKGLRELRPSPLDVGTIQRLYVLGKGNTQGFAEDLSKAGFSTERITSILESTEIPLSEVHIQKLYVLGKINANDAMKLLQRNGYKADESASIIASWKDPLGYNEVRRLYHMGKINEGELNKRLSSLGVADKDVELLKSIIFEIPGVSDLVRMAVREVFTPETANKYGLYEDYPTEFEAHAKTIGLSPEWSKRFWAAHWELPSLGMGFEMMHRRIITKPELAELMKAQDVMPFWRDKLMDLSYNTITRVDIRRMRAMGVITKEQVKEAYLDGGYSPENAELMTEYTEADVGGDDRELSKSEILTAYDGNVISRTDTVAYLDDYGYSPEDAELIVAIYDHKRSLRLLKSSITAIKKQLSNGVISENEASSKLAGLGLDSETVKANVEIAVVDRDSRVKTLDLATISKAFGKGVINKAEYIARLSNLGYNDDDIKILVGVNEK